MKGTVSEKQEQEGHEGNEGHEELQLMEKASELEIGALISDSGALSLTCSSFRARRVEVSMASEPFRSFVPFMLFLFLLLKSLLTAGASGRLREPIRSMVGGGGYSEGFGKANQSAEAA